MIPIWKYKLNENDIYAAMIYQEVISGKYFNVKSIELW
jgi:hypothetical protein